MNSKKTILFMFFLLLITKTIAQQNLIENGDFEYGTTASSPNQVNANISYADGWSDGCETWFNGPSTADLFDCNSTASFNMIPAHNEINPLNSNSCRFAGIADERESIKGTITEPLSQLYEYTISFVGTKLFFQYDDNDSEYQVVLRNSNDCSLEKIVYTSPPLTVYNYEGGGVTNFWQSFSGTFNLDASDISNNYNQLEIRIKSDGELSFYKFLIDNVVLEKEECTDYNGVAIENIDFFSTDNIICSGDTSTLVIDVAPDNLDCLIELIDITNNVTMIGPGNIFFTGTGFLYQEWSVTPNNTTTYELIITPNAGNNTPTCPISIFTTITVVPPPIINLPSSISMCDGNFQEICGPTAPSGSTYNYQWYGPDHDPTSVILLGEDICFTPSQTGNYTLIVTNENGCTTNHTITITDTIPQPDLGIVDCERAPFSNINILNQGFDNPDYTITWYHNGQVVQIGGETLMMSIEQGEVTVTISVDGCEPVSDSIEIYCCPEDLEIIMNCETGKMEVQNLPNNITINTMFWDYDFQTLPNSNSTSYQPTQEGVYSFGIVFTFPNGEKCHHFIHFKYTEEYCCKIIGSQAEVSLLNPNNNFYYVPNTPYGPMEIPTMCDRVALDGSLSTCEDAYFISIAPFDPVNWSNTNSPLFADWIPGQAPNYIDLTLAPFNLTFTNQTYYMIQFAVGPNWDAEYILFYYNCDVKNTMKEIIIAPNPTRGEFKVSLTNNKEKGALEVMDLVGNVIYKGTIIGDTATEINISRAKAGIYIVKVYIQEEVYSEKLIKE